MKQDSVVRIVVCGFAVAGVASLWFWLTGDLSLPLEMRVPGMDNAVESISSTGSRTGPDGELIKGDGEPADLGGAWPRFRGADIDNISKEDFEPLPKGGVFSKYWSIDVGEGFAGATILNGRVYLMDYDRENKADALRCLSLADGEEIWRYTYPVRVKRNHGMSRTVPTVSGDTIISIGPKCHVTCLDPLTGEKKWSLDMVYAFGADVPEWYAGQCPLVDRGRVILAPGGSALMVAVDRETGETVWETPNPHDWEMTHSSVMPMEWNGHRSYVYCASGGVVGVSAEDGSLLWETPDWKIRIANVPSPLMVGDGKIFLCGGYGAGSMMLQLQEQDGRIVPRTLFRLEPDRFGSTQHTPILYEGHIYAVREADGQLICLDLDGNEVWASTSAHKFGNGSYMIVGSLIYALNDSGLLSRVEATPEAFRLVDQNQVLEGHESWGPIALASGRMILRDLTKMVCLDVTSKQAAG